MGKIVLLTCLLQISPTAGFLMVVIFLFFTALLLKRLTGEHALTGAPFAWLGPDPNPYQPVVVLFASDGSETPVVPLVPSSIHEDELTKAIAESTNPVELKKLENHLYSLEQPLIEKTEAGDCPPWVLADLQVIARLKLLVSNKLTECQFTEDSFKHYVESFTSAQWYELLTPTMKELAKKFNSFPYLVHRSLDLRFSKAKKKAA